MQELFVKYAVPVGISIVTFFAPVHIIMSVVGGLLVFDFITGIWASLKRGESISSRRMSRTVGKAVLYQLAIISAFLLEVGIGGVIPVAKLVAGVIALTEGKSLVENLNTISGTNLFKVVLDKITYQQKP